jgi:predicted TIM-barrel fold metal-dependent hydrolase
LRNLLRLPKVAERMPGSLDRYLKSFYYDIAQAVMPPTLQMIQALAGTDRLLFGTDYPYSARGEAVISDAIEGVSAFQGFEGAARAKVERENALALFARFV